MKLASIMGNDFPLWRRQGFQSLYSKLQLCLDEFRVLVNPVSDQVFLATAIIWFVSAPISYELGRVLYDDDKFAWAASANYFLTETSLFPVAALFWCSSFVVTWLAGPLVFGIMF